jgi:hypothetical protein
VNRRVAHLFVALGVLAAVMCPLSARAVTINFDTFLSNTIITDQYSSLGVSFSSTAGGAVVWSNGEASSGSNFLVGSNTGVSGIYGDSFEPIIMTLATPVSGDISVTLISVGWATVAVTAFDDAGNAVSSRSVTHYESGPVNGLNNYDPITLNGSGITKLRFAVMTSYPGDGFGIDDVVFPAPVPEPGTIFLLGCGLVGLVKVRRTFGSR